MNSSYECNGLKERHGYKNGIAQYFYFNQLGVEFIMSVSADFGEHIYPTNDYWKENTKYVHHILFSGHIGRCILNKRNRNTIIEYIRKPIFYYDNKEDRKRFDNLFRSFDSIRLTSDTYEDINLEEQEILFGATDLMDSINNKIAFQYKRCACVKTTNILNNLITCKCNYNYTLQYPLVETSAKETIAIKMKSDFDAFIDKSLNTFANSFFDYYRKKNGL